MEKFPSDIEFKYPWRTYQKRALDELEEHLYDNHMHIVAPPGSGKTVLGLEVAVRLNKPTLIFAPSLAIRNQWIQRFCELFLKVKEKPGWISRDIKNPAFLTVTTYQALHAACSNATFDQEQEEPEEEVENGENGDEETDFEAKEIIELLKTQDIGTIVVDEAHHLKNAWWQSLTEVKQALNPTIVGLTATPPYDVSHSEWQRYIELNGPVDAEISVPELVAEENLCPHQDYVMLSSPTREEGQKIYNYRQRIKKMFSEIKADRTLITALAEHPIYRQPGDHLEWIYDHLEFYSSTLIFLHSVGKEITKEHREVIGDRKLNIPELNYEWMEILLAFYLYNDPDNFNSYEGHREKLMNKLKRNGIIERRSINFRHNRRINKLLSTSIGKLNSIERIVDFEHGHLKDDLRMVILTDYIRREFLVSEPENTLELNKIGVLPIFEKLRRANGQNKKIGVLTGSLIIIPASALETFKAISENYNFDTLSTAPLPFDDRYLIVNTTERMKHAIVHIITQVFKKGDIEVLVGTKSLLGEGWDAPFINSLILASFVGSYVLSNQMRGRAIRTQKGNTFKTSNIWHLACIDVTAPDGGDDIRLLKRRFKSFVGISLNGEATIGNGFERLKMPEPLDSKQKMDQANTMMLENAGKREQLKKRWEKALNDGRTLVEEVKVPFPEEKNYKEATSLYYRRTIGYLMAMLGSGVLAFAGEALEVLMRSSENINTLEDLYRALLVIGGMGVLFFGGFAFKTFRIYVKHRDISKDIHQIAEALLVSLIKAGFIHTDYSRLTIFSKVDNLGAVHCHLKGGTVFEKSTFIESLHEIISAVDNPRYLIIRKSLWLKIFSREDYHSVPERLGKNRTLAEYFKNQWSRFVGSCELVYTRTMQGRKILLQSRLHSLAAEFEEKAERIRKWK